MVRRFKIRKLPGKRGFKLSDFNTSITVTKTKKLANTRIQDILSFEKKTGRFHLTKRRR